MPIQEARIYDTRVLSVARQREKYGLRVLTTRKWLQGISKRDIDIWLPDAGPSLQLLEAWRKQEIIWNLFVAVYEQEQRACKQCRPVHYVDGAKVSPVGHVLYSPVRYLARLASEQVVTVMCWEQGEQCHRHTMVRLVQEQLTGVK
jgi:uncharacterized protein YeaO (DUF488 family)